MRLIINLVMAVIFGICSFSPAKADINRPHGGIKTRTILASVTSLLIWPGIGQAINDEDGDKIVTHAVIGILPPFRFWSAYDALIDRKGGYWKERI